MMLPRDDDDARATPVRLRRELIEEGWTDRALAAAVRDGAFAKARRGAYVAGQAWRSLDASGQHELTARAVLKQAGSDLVVSHGSGLILHGSPTWGLDLREVDVTRRDGRAGRREAGVRPHRGKILTGDLTTLHGVPVMAPTRLALEVGTVLGVEAALVHMNDLLQRGLTTVEKIDTRYRQSMEHWPSSLNLNVLLRLADGRCESVAETRVFYLCWRQGLPLPVPQYPIHDENGRVVARVDFAWPELGVFLEFDGFVKYSALLGPGETPADVVVREKRREDLICRLTGWRCLRIVWADLDHPGATALMIRRLLFPTGLAA